MHMRPAIRVPIELVIVSAMLGPAASCSGPRPSPNPIPLAEVTPKIVDLGAIEASEATFARGEFVLRNHGTAPLRILGLRASCGCTVPDEPPTVVSPGEAATLHLRVRPKNQSGEQGSLITLFSNDPISPAIDVQVRWTESYAISIDPQSLDLGRIRNGESAESAIDVTTSPGIRKHRLSIQSFNQHVHAFWDETRGPVVRDDGRQVRRLRVRLGPSRDQGSGTARVLISTEDESYSATVPIAWKFGPDIEVTPEAIYRSGVLAGSRVEARVSLAPTQARTLTVRHVEVDGERIDHRDGRLGDGAGSGMVVTFDIKAGRIPGLERHSVRIVLGEAQADIVELPVILSVK